METMEAPSLELAIQQSMDIDSPPSPTTRTQHTCTTASVSPTGSNNSTTMEFVGVKKSTYPYERPTLKTMEAAAVAAAARTSPPLANSKQQQYEQNQTPTSSHLLPLSELLLIADERNSNSPRRSLTEDDQQQQQQQEDNINNNNNRVSSLVCDIDVSLHQSIIESVNNNHHHNQMNVQVQEEGLRTKSASSSVIEANKTTTPTAVIEKKKKAKKASSSSSLSSACSCTEVAKVKGADQSVIKTNSSTKSSTSDGILSNCLSALNFVSGNRLGGGGDSKCGWGSSSSSASRSPRGSNKTSDSPEPVCGENCRRKGPIPTTGVETPPPTTGKSAKLCKSCRGHGMTKAAAGIDSGKGGSAAGGSKDKDTSHGVLPAVVASKTKRSNWALRFNCARLKGSKSSSSIASSSSSAPSASVKESGCKCSPESTTKASLTKNKKPKKNGQEPVIAAEVMSGSTVASSCSRVTPLGISATTFASSSSSSSVNCGFGKEPSFGDMTNDQVATAATAPKDQSTRLSFVEMSTEDLDEWARIQREKEIEDGVEAPPGYLPKFQFNKVTQSGGGAVAQTSVPATTSVGETTAATSDDVATPRLENFLGTPSPSPIGSTTTPWPHLIGVPSQLDWQAQQQRFLMQQALLASSSAASGAPVNKMLNQNQSPQALKVHSQVDFIHCLVPDLQKITSCGFYWGKMDRYQAETLLDGKPEGTFLLRDSAQEEYLFSVSFRKYGRSLHARIEQFNHKFSFDSHDPGVYTANTVTGLLEHYKDPSCVMFFEPMLTQPLNRNFCFSLQQLCRATIVSETTYDNIGDLKLPGVMKGYLREYHYKQKVRVKLFDEYRAIQQGMWMGN